MKFYFFLILTLLIISAIILETSALATPTAADNTSLTRLNMKSYGDHDAGYDARILAIRPKYVIDNPPHGLYGEMENPQYTADWLLQNVSGYQAAGIKVIGYITCGYEGRGGDDHYALNWYSLEMNRKLITNMATIDHVDGVFIDECSDYPHTSSKAYLKALTDLAHSYGLITWGNVGVDDFDSWFFTEGGFDFMQSSEAWGGQSLSPVQRAYGSRISVTGYSYRYNADTAVRLTLDAWSKGLAYCYINTVEYTSIAPWFEDYAARLRTAQDNYTWPPDPGTTPSPTPTPTVSPTSTPTPTPDTYPLVSTYDSTSISSSRATLNGNLVSLGSADRVTVSFEYGSTASYGRTTTGQFKTSTGTFSAYISRLTPNTTYHYRAKAVGDGTTYGEDRQFTTTGSTPGSTLDHYTVYTISSSKTAGTPFSVTVQAKDRYNNNISTGSETLNITLAQPDAGATPTSVTTTNGTVTFNMTVTKALSNQVLTFTGTTSGKIGTSNTFNVNPGAKTKLLWGIQPPSSVTAGATWSSFTMKITDQYGNQTAGTDTVTIAPSTGSLNGTLSRAAVAGLATFNNISRNQSGNLTLMATSGSLTAAPNSGIITVTSSSSTLYEHYYSPLNNITGFANYSSQTFIPQFPHTIKQVNLELDNYLGAVTSGYITVSIRAVNGNGEPVGPDLAVSSPLAEASIPSTPTLISFNLGNGCVLTANTQYAILVHSDVIGIFSAVDTPGSYNKGTYMASNNGSNWVHYPAYDLWFEELGTASIP